MTINLEFSLLVGLVIGLVQIVKLLKVEKRYLPLVAIGLGIGIAFLAGFDNFFTSIIMTGLVVGLSAVGLFNVGKKTVLGK